MHFKDDFLSSAGTELCEDRLTPYDCKPIFINDTTSINKISVTRKQPSEIQTNQWKLPMPNFMSKTKCIDPAGDGNCLFRALQKSYYGTETLRDCYRLRKEITRYMIQNPTSMLCPNYFPYSIAEWAIMNTDFQQDDNHSLARYCDRMKDATPDSCEYGTVIETFTFSIIEQVNIVIYQTLIDQTVLSYKKRAENIVSDKNGSTICILNTGNHYQSLFRMYDTDAVQFLTPTIILMNLK
jgi:hypothetical protein